MSTTTIKHFRINGRSHFLCHNTSTDARTVEDEVGASLLTFTSTLDIHAHNGKYAGRLFVRDQVWHMQNADGEVISTHSACDNYSHDGIVGAECFASSALLNVD